MSIHKIFIMVKFCTESNLQIIYIYFLFCYTFSVFHFPFSQALFPLYHPLLTWTDSENPGIKAVSFWSISQAFCNLLWACEPWTALLKFPVISSMTYWEQRILWKLFIYNHCTLVVWDIGLTRADLWWHYKLYESQAFHKLLLSEAFLQIDRIYFHFSHTVEKMDNKVI